MVDDNNDVTEVTSVLIKQLGYTVQLAPDASKALRMLEQESFDLVFSDIMMPGKMDGLELARTIQKVRPQLPVLLASGSNKLVDEARQHFTTLQKPYQISDLDRAIQALLLARRDGVSSNNLVDLGKAKRERGKLDKH
jgi:CheY-like chemotaxis protein